MKQAMETIRKYRHMIKPFDYIIVVSLILLSFLPLVIFGMQQRNSALNDANSDLVARITRDGKLLKTVNLSKNKKHYFINYKWSGGKYNIIEVDGNRIRDYRDETPNQIAVRTSWISKPGETAVNLPHKILIEVVRKDKPNTATPDNIVQP